MFLVAKILNHTHWSFVKNLEHCHIMMPATQHHFQVYVRSDATLHIKKNPSSNIKGSRKSPTKAGDLDSPPHPTSTPHCLTLCERLTYLFWKDLQTCWFPLCPTSLHSSTPLFLWRARGEKTLPWRCWIVAHFSDLGSHDYMRKLYLPTWHLWYVLLESGLLIW